MSCTGLLGGVGTVPAGAVNDVVQLYGNRVVELATTDNVVV